MSKTRRTWWGNMGDGDDGKPRLIKLVEIEWENRLHAHGEIVSQMCQDCEDGWSVFMIGMCHIEYGYFAMMFQAISPDGTQVKHFFCDMNRDNTVLNPVDAGDRPFEWFANKAMEMGGGA